jgi:hypothetical protein
MDETIPELSPLPKEIAGPRRRWWPPWRKRNCEARVTLLQIRLRSHQALVAGDARAEVKFTVEGAQGLAGTLGAQDTVTPAFDHRFVREGRADTDVQLVFALQIAFADPLNYGLQARRTLDTTRTYRCPGHVDHEVLGIRDENPNGWYEFQFDFRIELRPV